MTVQPILGPIADYALSGLTSVSTIALNSLVAPDYSDLTSMFVGRDGSGGNPDPGDTIGLVLNKAGMGNQTAEAFIDSQSEINLSAGPFVKDTADDLVLVSGDNFTEGDLYAIDFDITGKNASSPGLSVNGSTPVAISDTGDFSVSLKLVAGATTASGLRLAGTGALLTVDNLSVKHIPGQHLVAPADNQRPVLDLTNGVYSPDYDGVDDSLSMDFAGGAGPSDCSVFFAVKTTDTQFILASLSSSGGSWFGPAVDGDTSTALSSNSGLSIGYKVNGLDEAPSTRDDLHTLFSTGEFTLLEITNLNLSGWSELRLSGYGGWQIDGNLIGPIIVETSKLTNSLRRTIEQDLKRKAGIQ